MKIVSFYRFTAVSDPAKLQADFQPLCEEHGFLGTVLIAEEGVNGTLTGGEKELQSIFRWLEKELARSSFVIVRTHKSDKYDRYLADIFYLPGNNDPDTVTARGRYLNQEILDHGMAKVWEE